MILVSLRLVIADKAETATKITQGENVLMAKDVVSKLDGEYLSKSFWNWWREQTEPATIVVVPHSKLLERFKIIGNNAKSIANRAIWDARLPTCLLHIADSITIALKEDEVTLKWNKLQ